MQNVDPPWVSALKAGLYSLYLSVYPVVTAAVIYGWMTGPSKGGFNDWPTFLSWAKVAWFPCVMGLVFQIGPYARAKQSLTASQPGSTTLPPPEQNQPPK